MLALASCFDGAAGRPAGLTHIFSSEEMLSGVIFFLNNVNVADQHLVAVGAIFIGDTILQAFRNKAVARGRLKL
jgi:hypothetical protein